MASAEDDAVNIADKIVAGERPATSNNLYIDDVLLQAREFLLDVEIVRDGGFPCIRREDDSLVPLALGLRPDYFAPYILDAYFWGRRFGEEEGLTLVSPDTAKDFFRTGVIRFLASRIRSLVDVPEHRFFARVSLRLPRLNFTGTGLSKVITTGFHVDVSASPNLRVHVSPTFRRSWRYFGNPTSPVKGILTGGIYEFGVDGGPYASITPDPATFDIPYATVSPALSL